MDRRKLLLKMIGDAVVAIPWYLTGSIPSANCVRAYQAIGAASLAASYSNLVSPGTGDATTAADPTWDASTGWVFNGVDQYLNIGVGRATTAGNGTMIIRFSDANDVSNTPVCGYWEDQITTDRWVLYPRTSTVNTARFVQGHAAGEFITSSPKVLAGVLACNATKGYRDGVEDAASMAASGTLVTNTNIYIGCWNRKSLGAVDFKAANVQAFALYDINLTAAQILALSLRMLSLP